MAFDENQNHSISLEEASKMTAEYRGLIAAGDTISAAFGKKAIEGIITQDNCKGIRAYFARNEEGKITLILVGVNDEGNDMHEGLIAEWGGLCPPMCSIPNLLNS
jgi:hypothetical protein